MYLYLYDSFLNNKKYNSVLARIETRLTDLGIGGKIFRLSPLRNLNELLTDEIHGGVKTLVVVGNDATFARIAGLVAEHDIVLGYIPVGPDSDLARPFGLKKAEGACDIVAARIIKRIDVGRVNDGYFLSELDIASDNVSLTCEGKFTIHPQQSNNTIKVFNIVAHPVFDDYYGKPCDGRLEVMVRPLQRGFFGKKSLPESVIPFQKIEIRGKGGVPITVDGNRVIKTPTFVEVVPNKLRVIVGKERFF